MVGVPDEYRGETVKAFVSLKPGAKATPAELQTFCKERMAAYKYPRMIEAKPATRAQHLLMHSLADCGRDSEKLGWKTAAERAASDKRKFSCSCTSVRRCAVEAVAAARAQGGPVAADSARIGTRLNFSLVQIRHAST